MPSVIKIRQAVNADCEKIMQIIDSAKKYLQEQGLPQWQNGYGPNTEMVEGDLQAEDGYVLLFDGEICGYAALVQGDEEDCYAQMTGGKWDETHPNFMVIHRVALDSKVRGQGLSQKLLQFLIEIAAEKGFYDIRIDTHAGNLIMQKAILRAGFVYRGMIQIPIPNGERLTYQLVLS